LHYFAFDALQFIFVVNVLQSVFFIFIKLNGEGASPFPVPHPLENFLFKKENDVCELKGGRPVNGIASELPMQRIWDLYCVF